MRSQFRSWGLYPQINQKGVHIEDRHRSLPSDIHSMLPYGNGRSYGDSCLNADGIVISTRYLKHFIDFDTDTGILRCESGVLLGEILDLIVPAGWFLPVTPGTKFVTVGGAVANDVHGKNHHTEGTFGCHVMQFELLRSDGHRLLCSPSENSEYFSATISGLGLTGLITWVELRLKKISSSNLAMENIKFSCLDEFFSLSEESDGVYEYTMSWVDCVASGDKLGRGHFTRANHIKGSSIEPNTKKIKFKMPVTPPISFINSLNLRMLNALYYNRQLQKVVSKVGPYEPFFFPLDSILEWNRIYGPKGFLQYQCIVPKESSKDVMREILEIISKSGMGSSLAIMKVCGDVKSPGLMSFPMSGTTLALDFPYVENKTLPLFAILDELVIQVGGRLYPAKDAHMNAKLFKAFYPNWETLQQYKDPKFSSSMWKRVMEED